MADHYSKPGITIILAWIVSYAAADTTGQGDFRARVEHAMAKAGISFNGEFKSESFRSTISGDGLYEKARTREPNEYSSVDFDILARPNASVSGRLILRMHHNWPNFFSDPGNPIFSRWISIDGAIADMIPFHVGDIKARYTPLTLYAPEITPLYEPLIFKRLRVNAMNELFLGNDNRPLHGLTTGFDGALKPLLDELHVNLLGARLRSIQVNGKFVANLFELDPNFNKFLFGATFDTRFVKGITIGSSYLAIADDKRSSRLSDTIADTLAQRTIIADVRAGCDIAPWLGWQKNEVRIYGEAAFSYDDSSWYNRGDRDDYRHRPIIGSASYGGISAHIDALSPIRIDMDLRYIRNKKDYRNELAQSPTFLGKRIMNIESDSIYSQNTIPNHYSTFDAMYHYVFKFCPSEASNLWYKAPFTKNAYSSNVNSRDGLNNIAAIGLDPSVQLIMPFGPATPNRQGITADVSTKTVDSGLELRALFSSLSERTPVVDTGSRTTTDFFQGGFGMSMNLTKWVNRLPYPLEFSGSFVRSSMRNQKSESAITSDFVNAGIVWKFWKQTSFLGGVQHIKNTYTTGLIGCALRQIHWSTGLDWTVTQGADVVGSIGQIIVKAPDDQIPVPGAGKASIDNFKQLLSEVSLKVLF
jgi:hypothetical protein